MKICPSCRQTYTDDDLNFCLTDGSFLSAAPSNEPKTVYMDQSRITNQTNWGQTGFQEPPAVWQNQQNIQQQSPNYPVRAQSQEQTMAIFSLILGIFALFVSCFFGGIPLGALATILGVLALNNERKNPARYGGKGMAIAGITTGVIGFFISILILLAAIAG